MVDAVCYDDLDRKGAEMDDPVAELEQDFYHRLIEIPGSNPDDIDRGVGLILMMSKGVTTESAQSFAHRIDAEGKKDERIDHVDTSFTDLGDGKWRLDIALFPQGALQLLADTKANTITRVT